jgi:quinol-cytochrome oxidoreductase complex cytochrome b subunit
MAIAHLVVPFTLRSKKKKPSDSRSRRNTSIFFFLNIMFLGALWLLSQFYSIPPTEILLSWIFVTILMIVFLWFVDRRAARMVLDDLSRSP